MIGDSYRITLRVCYFCYYSITMSAIIVLVMHFFEVSLDWRSLVTGYHELFA